MRITKLHLIIIFIILAGGSYLGFNYYKKVDTEKKEAERQKLLEERQAKLSREKESARRYLDNNAVKSEDESAFKKSAEESISVAENMLEETYSKGKDITLPELTLKKSKDSFSSKSFKQAANLARQAIEELRQAPAAKEYEETAAPARTGEVIYTVKRGDNLWNIAKMNHHYGRGSKWVRIWRTNEEKVPDFDIIIPGQKLVIPED